MGITHACFGLSYLLALLLELYQLRRPGPTARALGVFFGMAGMIAHTIFLGVHRPSPASAYGSLLIIAWVFTCFYLVGTFHRKSRPMALFVLPIIEIFVWTSLLMFQSSGSNSDWISGEHIWGIVHGLLVLAAAIGITVGFIASVMYLLQARRLRKKLPPLGSIRLLSLERLETMNRRAINSAFPLLTAGVALGAVRIPFEDFSLSDWTAIKLMSTAALWILALMLLYLRYARHLASKRLAWMSIVAFAVMLLALMTSHPYAIKGVGQ